MIIEIRKAGFVNKGAELMLHAAIQQIRKKYPDAKITMAPMFGGANDTFEKMSALGLYPKAWVWYKGLDLGWVAKFIPKKIRKLYGLILPQDVDVVLDAAGFSYSDQWSILSTMELASTSARIKKNKSKLILLPQALGPYKTMGVRRYVEKLAKNADLIFARDEDSFKYLTEITGEKENIKIYPDFTNLVEGILPGNFTIIEGRVAIVPNYRMIDKTSEAESEAYLPFLIKVTKHLIERKKKPFLLIHEGEGDRKIADMVSCAVGGVEIIKETDPLYIKGILGSCEAVVGSRFHSLVSALSQGVPALATGWSHKYSRLFEDYDFNEGMISVVSTDELIREKIDILIGCDSFIVRNKLKAKSIEMRCKSENMWDLVFSVIDNGIKIKK